MSSLTYPVEIPLSKKKLVLLLAGSFGFVGLGAWFAFSPPSVSNPFWGHPAVMMFTGYASLLFFGTVAVFLIRKLADRKPGLTITSEGLVDYSSAVTAGQILWSDVTRISVFELNGQKLILLHVINPEVYVDRQTRSFKRRMMKMNQEMFGTPLSISANGLKISFDELMMLVTEGWNTSRLTQRWA